MPISKVSNDIKAIVEGKIVEALTEVGVGDAKEVLTSVSPT